MTAILFLHGFGTVGAGELSDALAAEFPGAELLRPDLPPNPAEAARVIDSLLRQVGDDMLLVGASLGGFYAACFALERGLPAVLVNPATDAPRQASDLVGEHHNYVTGEPFTFKASYLDALRLMADGAEAGWRVTKKSKVVAAVALDDEVVPPGETFDWCRRHGVGIRTYEDKGHRFLDVAALMPLVHEHASRHLPGLTATGGFGPR